MSDQPPQDAPEPRRAVDRLREQVDALGRTERELTELMGLGAGPLGSSHRPTAPSARRKTDAPPVLVGPYRLLRVLGEGGMGTVYEAQDPDGGERIALKVLRVGPDAAESWRRFEREADFLAQLDHPGIARVLATGRHRDPRGGEAAWIAMELINGRPIRRHADEEGLDARERIGLLLQVCEAVSHAHARGIIHRDLKPDNILVDRSGRVRVLDFGVARAMDEREISRTQLTLAGDIVGTLSYMSPEQACGRADEVDERSDVYALGVVAFELLSGRLPHDLTGLALPDALGRIRDLDADRLRASDPEVRAGLDVVVGKALEKEPERRYASLSEFAADLRRYLTHQPIEARPPSALYRLGRFARRNRPLAMAILGLVLVLATAVVVTTRLALSEAEQRRRADTTATRALNREQEALRAQYRAQLAAARAAADQGDTNAARRLLDAAPAAHRGWEWRQLHAALDQSLAQWNVPPGEPVALAFRQDGRSVSLAAEGGIDLRSVPDGELIRRWRPKAGERVAELSPDGERALLIRLDGKEVGTPGHGSSSGEVFLLDLDSGAQVPLGTGVIEHLDFSLDSAMATLCVPEDQSGEAWTGVFVDGRTGALLGRVRAGDFPKQFVVRDGLAVQAAAHGNGLDIHDLATGQLRHVDGPMITGVIAPSHGGFVLGPLPLVGRFVAWEFGTWRPLDWDQEGPDPSPMSSSAFSTSGRLLAVVGGDGVTHLREARTGRRIATFGRADVSGRVPAPVLHETTGVIAVADAFHAILVASIEDGRPLRRFAGHDRWLASLGLSDDGKLLASLDGSGRVRLWDMADPSEPGLLKGHQSYVYDVRVSPDGRRVASAAWDGTTRVWDLATGRPVAELLDPASVPYFGELGWSPDSSRLVSVHGFEVSLWNMQTGALISHRTLNDAARQPSSSTEPVGVEWWPDGRGFLVGSRDREVHEYRLTAEGALSPHELLPIRGEALDFSPDGRLLALSLESGVELRDARDWDLLMREEVSAERCRAVAFSPDGERLAAVCDDSRLRVWDVASRERLLDVAAHGDLAYGLAWSPDGTRIATGGSDRVVRIWSTDRGEELAALSGHSSYAYALDWSPDGRTLVSGSGDTTVRLWDQQPTGKRLAARRERDRLQAGLESEVGELLQRAPTAAEAFEEIAGRSDWSAAERQVAADLLLGLGAAR